MDMKVIKIFDTTLRDGEQAPGCSMDLSEKLDVARRLEKLRVDVIEAGFAIASPGDYESVREIAATVKNSTVASLARATVKDIDAAYSAVKGAESPRIHVFLATSPLHMKYKLKMTPDEVLETSVRMVKYAKSMCADIEFSAEDASRSDYAFLARVFSEVIAAGATTINVPDTVGYAAPGEMGKLIAYLMEHVSGVEKVDVSVHCHNDLGMAVANSLASVKAGATQVECTINGIGERAGNAALEELVMAIGTRPDFFGAKTGIDTAGLYPTSRLVASVTGIKLPPNKAIVGGNAFAHEAGIHQHGVAANPMTYEIMTPESVGIPSSSASMVLGKHSGRHAFADRLSELGYSLSEERLNEIFEQFKVLADKKKTITDKDIMALVQSRRIEVPDAYRLEKFVINSGNAIRATALVNVMRKGEELEQVALGDGPVDAAFNAINMIAQKNIVLDDYSLRSVTEGHDALGEAVVKLTYEGISVTGRGVSTDIIEASIKAYLNGVNKILAEWEMRGTYELAATEHI